MCLTVNSFSACVEGCSTLALSGWQQKVIFRLDYLVFCPLDGRNIHVVGGGAHIFILLVSKDVNSNQVHLQDKKMSRGQTTLDWTVLFEDKTLLTPSFN